MSVVYPTIHLNGTSAQSLLNDLRNAIEKTQAAISALAACNPNGRDYYPQGSTAYPAASEQHRVRLRMLESVEQQLTDQALHIQEVSRS